MMVMSVCLFVCLSTHVTRKHTAEIHLILCMLPVAVARSSSDGIAMRYVFPVSVDDVMFSRNDSWHVTWRRWNATGLIAEILTK